MSPTEIPPAEVDPVAAELAQLHIERARVVRDLHDHVVQRLFAVGLSLQRSTSSIADSAAAITVDRAIGEIDEAIADLRSVIYGLRSDLRRDGDLRRRLLAIADNAGSGPPIVSVRTSGPVDTLIGAQLAADVEAVVREGVSNAMRHAQASTITATVSAQGDVMVIVSDNGIGIPDDAVHRGLDHLAQRAADNGGSLTITSRNGGGAELRWVVPLTH